MEDATQDKMLQLHALEKELLDIAIMILGYGWVNMLPFTQIKMVVGDPDYIQRKGHILIEKLMMVLQILEILLVKMEIPDQVHGMVHAKMAQLINITQIFY